MKRVSIVGFGKIGQAVAAAVLQRNIAVKAVDTNKGLQDAFRDGTFKSNEPGLASRLKKGYASGRLEVEGEYSALEGSRAMIVCIPLLVDNNKKTILEPFLECMRNLAPHLETQCVLSVETSLPVGTSRSVILPLIEGTGRKHGIDFFLVHSPERIKSGSMLKQLSRTPKIVGGIDHLALREGLRVYGWFIDKKLLRSVGSIEAAEFIKLAGMAYRDINIALANQLARFAAEANIDIEPGIDLANTDGEAFLLRPGIGVGGHCTPVYPYFLVENFRERGLEFTLGIEGRRINDSMAEYALERATKAAEIRKALILGLGFRPDVKEDTFSTAYLLKESFERRKIDCVLHDSYFSQEEIRAKGFHPVRDIYSEPVDAVFLTTFHSPYKSINWTRLKDMGCRLVVDGRNSLDRTAIEKAGMIYMGIGH